MWYGIGISVVTSYFIRDYSDNEQLVWTVFMAFWAYYAVRVSRSFFWLMWGAENVRIDGVSLTLKRATGKAGKAIPYYIENIKKIRVSLPKKGSFQSSWEASPWIVREGERIEFDYMGKVVRFGRKLDEKDAKLLYDLITHKLEEQLKRAAKKEKNNQ